MSGGRVHGTRRRTARHDHDWTRSSANQRVRDAARQQGARRAEAVAPHNKKIELVRLLLEQRTGACLDQHHLNAETRFAELTFSVCERPGEVAMPNVGDGTHSHSSADDGARSDQGLFGREKADCHPVGGHCLRPCECGM
jgi:hypothetical protein